MSPHLLDDQFSPLKNFSSKELEAIRLLRNRIHVLIGHINTARVFCFVIGIFNLVALVAFYFDGDNHFFTTQLELFRLGISAMVYLILGFLIKQRPKRVLTIVFSIYSINTFYLWYLWIGGLSIFFAGLQLLLGYVLYRGLMASRELPKKRHLIEKLDAPKDWLIAIDNLKTVPTTKDLR